MQLAAQRERIFQGEWSNFFGIDSETLTDDVKSRNIIGSICMSLRSVLRFYRAGDLLFHTPRQLTSIPVEINLGDPDIDTLVEGYTRMKAWISSHALVVLLLEVIHIPELRRLILHRCFSWRLQWLCFSCQL